MGQTYIVTLAGFGVLVFAYSMSQWLLSVLTGAGLTWHDFLAVLSSAATSFFIFPFMTLLFVFTHKFVPVSSGGYL